MVDMSCNIACGAVMVDNYSPHRACTAQHSTADRPHVWCRAVGFCSYAFLMWLALAAQQLVIDYRVAIISSHPLCLPPPTGG